tara:strand:+ start:4117 stop:4293 length:177 start_codon:yes stop_codon:yes gene_type:complete
MRTEWEAKGTPMMSGKVTKDGDVWVAVRKIHDGDRLVVETMATADKSAAVHFMIFGGS